MRPVSPRMLLAAFTLAACCVMSPAQAATTRHSTTTDEIDELSGDGWQLLSAGEPAADKGAPKTTTSKKPAVAKKTPAAAASDETASRPATTTAAASTDTASTASPPQPSAPPPQPYGLVAGESGESQLLAWAKRAGWTVLWNVQDAWIVPGNKEYGNDFETAVKQVTEDLAANGADVLGDSWRGNRTIIITQNGAAAQ